MQPLDERDHRAAARAVLKPLILAARTTTELSPAEQRVVATWLFKTDAMLASISNPHPRTAVAYLRRRCMPPPEVTIWIGQLTPEMVGGPPPTNLPLKPERYPAIVVPDAFGSPGLQLGRFISVILGQPEGAGNAIAHPIVTDGYLLRIWPPRDANTIAWPPPMAIDRATHRAVLAMFMAGMGWARPLEP